MNIYFSGIGGVGIGPLAEIAHDAGYEIQGSDQHESLMTRELQKRGVTIEFNQDGSFLEECHQHKSIDWFVHTAALPADHPELIRARELGIRTAKRDELLAHIIADKQLKLIAVAGTHGKTTTTGMMVWALQELGVPVSYSVGTTLSFGPSGKFNPASEYFVYECDEFDRNFLHFQPHLSIVTSIDYDHPDTYPSEADYKAAFRQFVQQSNHTILWQADGDYIEDSTADAWHLQPDEVANLALPGAHNRRNATLVLKALEYLNIGDNSGDSIILEQFPGTNRRFERLADNLYSDYGHHPVEIAATLQMARELSDHVVLIYQPHQNVRQHEIRDQYTNQFELADDVYWLPTYLSREDPNLEILTPEQLTANLTNRDNIHQADLTTELWEKIEQARHAGKLVLCMGAGSIDAWVRTQNDIKKVANVLVIDRAGNLILQQRDNTPGINNPGMITGFGGAVESGELTSDAATRELREETNLAFISDDLQYLTSVYQSHVNDGSPRWVSYFTLKNCDVDNLQVFEGEGYVVVPPDADLATINLSPTAREAIARYRAALTNRS